MKISLYLHTVNDSSEIIRPQGEIGNTVSRRNKDDPIADANSSNSHALLSAQSSLFVL